MEVLGLNERFLIVIGTCPPKIQTPIRNFMRVINLCFILMVLSWTCGASAVHLLQKVATDSVLSDLIIPMASVIIVLGELGSIASVSFNADKVRRLHKRLQEIVDNGKS